MKYTIFEKEINYIIDDKLKDNIKTLLNNLPDYFYTIEAASTGKYHPQYAQGIRGLVRHTKSVVFMAHTLFDIYKFDNHTKDLIIISLLIHDGLKKGFIEEKYTRFDHPLLIKEFINNLNNQLTISDEDKNIIINNVSSHMGRWNTSDYSKIILPTPKTVVEKFVHMCDFLASRKSININFDSNDNIIE